MTPPRILPLVLALAGCTASLGSVGVLGPTADPIGIKILRPGAVGRACRTSWLGVFGERGEPTIADAASSIYALDAEGDILADATFRRSVLVTGLYNRRCLEVEATLGRLIPTVTIPMPPGHGGHH